MYSTLHSNRDYDTTYRLVRAIPLYVPIDCIGTYNSIALTYRYGY